jgi:hypothetical protein
MCGCARVYCCMYAYRIGRLKIRALLDQHSHRFHVPVHTRVHQRCVTVLPRQPASERRSGAAATHARVPMHYVRLNEIKCVYLCAALD